MTQDDTRSNFLTALKNARAERVVALTPFENGFVDDCYDALNFSPRMRSSIDKMVGKYAAKIGFRDSKSTLAALADKEEQKIIQERAANQVVAVGGKMVMRKQPPLRVATFKKQKE